MIKNIQGMAAAFAAVLVLMALSLPMAGSGQARIPVAAPGTAATDEVRVAQVVGGQQSICSSSPIPWGWIIVNDSWDPTRCGNPTSTTYNVRTIERYDNRPKGSTMKVCSYSPTPEGWTDVDSAWDPTSCGHPTSISNNMKTIRRLSDVRHHRRVAGDTLAAFMADRAAPARRMPATAWPTQLSSIAARHIRPYKEMAFPYSPAFPAIR